MPNILNFPTEFDSLDLIRSLETFVLLWQKPELWPWSCAWAKLNNIPITPKYGKNLLIKNQVSTILVLKAILDNTEPIMLV